MSGILINIKAGPTVEESTVTATGKLIHIIGDTEKPSFGIGTDVELKEKIEKYFGKEPNDVYLNSPTPWGDLYKSYLWPQVQRVIELKRVQILEVDTKPTILLTKTLTNETDKLGTFTTTLSEQVTNTISNDWSNSSKVCTNEMVKYDIDFLGIGAVGEKCFCFEQLWGKSETLSKLTTVGTETGVAVDLKPGESAIVELCANSGTMKLRVTYETYLTGLTAVNYSPPYKGHHFWGLPIEAVLGDINKVQIVQDIELGICTGAIPKVKSTKTNEKLIFHLAEHPDEPPSEI